MKKILEEEKREYFTFTPKEEKVKSLILKGLDTDDDPEEILRCLKNSENENIEFISVKRFKTKHSIKNNYETALFIVQCTYNTKLSEIYKIRVVENRIIKWEKIIKNNIISQCTKCQRFGHTASNCKLQYRCVKCGQNHETSQCEIPKMISENEKEIVESRKKLKCVLCKQEGHPASYKGCPRYKTIKERLKKRQEENQKKREMKTAMYNNFTNPSMSFSAILGKNNQTKDKDTDFKEILHFIKNISIKIDKIENKVNDHNNKIDILYNVLNFNN